MSKYNRDFLVPYLENLCALHLAHRKVNHDIDKLKREINSCNRGISLPSAAEPEYENIISGKNGFQLILVLITFFGSLFMFSLAKSLGGFVGGFVNIIAWFAIISSILGILVFFSNSRDISRKNEKLELDYKERIKKREKAKKMNESLLAAVPQKKKTLDSLYDEKTKIRDLLTQAYNVNVIPLQYRDIYAIMYLYRWFVGGREDDVGAALAVYVLEEIKAKLDTIIENQSEIILNQQIERAERMKSFEAQERHHAEMCDKLDKMQVTAEEHSQYLEMIESNTKATAYFAAAEYFRKL